MEIIVEQTYRIGDHYYGSLSILKQISPLKSTFGWYIGVTNLIFGGDLGYWTPN